MLKAIRKLMDSLAAPAGSDETPTDDHRTRLATAVLLVEVSRADFEESDVERDAILALVRQTFELSEDEASDLFELARKESGEAIAIRPFTKLLNERCTPDEKVHIVELLWRVAYADGRKDKYEEHIIRRIADLLYVSHREFIAARQKVEAGLTEER